MMIPQQPYGAPQVYPGQPAYGMQPGAAQPFPQQLAIPNQPPVRQPTQWQTPPSVAANPQPPIPSTARGVPAETPARFLMPRPEALGVSASLNVPTATPTAPVVAPQVDWNHIQARMERLGVVGYQKMRLQTGAVHVMLTMPNVQPVQGQGATEAAAILAALQQAEAGR
jgi:hypothetical protein